MGNTAIIKAKGKRIGVYLHWNGGVDSVEAFLEYCKLKEYRGFEDSYGIARFCQVVGNYFGGSCSIGIETNLSEIESKVEEMGLDNGMYIVKGWDIVRRIDAPKGREGYDRTEMLISIDEAQPLNEQFGKDFFTVEEIDTKDLKIGDKVFVYDNVYGKMEKFEVVGFGVDEFCNGTNVNGMPYVNKYLNDDTYSKNINNYIRTDKVKKVKED